MSAQNIQAIEQEANARFHIQNLVYPSGLYSETIKGIIPKMPQPEDVLFAVDENGVPKVEQFVGTENSVIYDVVKETLCNICDLNWESMKCYILFKLEKQTDRDEFSEQSLTKLCWALGTISGKLPETDEKRF